MDSILRDLTNYWTWLLDYLHEVIASTPNCQRNFYFDEDYQACVPSCQNWSEHGEGATIALRVVILTSNSIGMILAITTIIVSAIQYKSMFQFPSLFLVYSCVDILLVDACLVIGHSNINLFCTSSTILNNTVTPFCAVTGMILNYSYLQLSLWWLFHMSIMFWGIWFPFHYDRHKKNGNFKKLAIILTIVGLLVPIIAVIIAVADHAVESRREDGAFSGRLGYGDFQHLPIFCAPVHVALYSIILPLVLTLALGGPLILLVFFRFCKRSAKVGTTELKLMVVLIYYVLVSCANIIEFTIILRNVDALSESKSSYFTCESFGLDANKQCQRGFEEYDVAVVTAVILTVVAFYPLYVLLFAVNIQKTLKWFHKGDFLKSSLFMSK